MTNQEIAGMFYNLSNLLEIKGENSFRINAIRKSAGIIEDLTDEVSELYPAGKLTNYPGLGKGMFLKIEELLRSGTLKEYETLKKEIPAGLLDILSIPQVGPKTTQLLYKKLGIKTVDELERAAREGKIHNLFRMGEKTEENIIKGIELFRGKKGRYLLGDALPLAEDIINRLGKQKEIEQIAYCGSLRRGKETIGDIDILITTSSSSKVMDFFVEQDFVGQVLSRGNTKSSILVLNNMQVDLRTVEEDSFGAALQYFTGSKEHNINLRELAAKRGLKINEYGVWKGEIKIAGREEESVYETLDLRWIPPELREGKEEIIYSQKGILPELVELKDIKGDMQVHSTWSDGAYTIEQIKDIAKKKNYKYIAITDHSQSLKIAGGLTPEELKEQLKQIQEINKKQKSVYILSGMEVDIKKDGTLDMEDELLSQIDVVIAAIHSNFKMDKKRQTDRMIKALRNKNVSIISHPTGRLIGQREPYELDMDKIFEAAAEEKVALEINAHPQRLDLRDIFCKKAKDYGVKFSVGTDAHKIGQLDFMGLGVTVARRGWLEKKDIINCSEKEELLKNLRR